MENNSGIIRKKRNKFSMISNTLALDPKISAKAKGIYLIICAELNKVNYTVYKSTIATYCKDGRDSFESGWQELKKAGYLLQTKSKAPNGKWVYEYELLDEPEINHNDSENTEEPDTENPYVADEKPDTEKPYLENPYVYNKPERRKTRVNITSSSSSSSSTPREEVNEQPVPLDDDDVKELNEITRIVFDVSEGKRLSSLPLKYGCDGNMIYPALKIALDNGAINLVGYVNKIFKDWKDSEIKHLSDLDINGVSTKEDIEKQVELYRGQLEEDNKNGRNFMSGLPDRAYEFGVFTDYSKEYRALAKIYPPNAFFDKLREAVINGLPVNSTIKTELINNRKYRY